MRKLTRLAALVGLAAAGCPLGAQRFQVQYLYDEVKSSLSIVDLQFPSAMRGIAAGLITTDTRRKPVELMTADGGAHWQTAELPDDPVSLFFLNESIGWLVGAKNLYRTQEGGRGWVKLPKMPQLAERVYFADANKGWAACDNKSVLATTDGGAHWQPVALDTEPPGTPQTTAYRWIAFASANAGLVLGANVPPRRSRFPDWMMPDSVVSQRETPHLGITLQTVDGGKTWKTSTVSMFGQFTRVRFSPVEMGFGLALIEHLPSFQYPSEVALLEWRTGANRVLYRDKDVFVTDVWVSAAGTSYLAGLALSSRLYTVVPQKVKVLKSDDLKTWTPIDVDYRAIANRVFLAGAGRDGLWLATNNGAILKLSF